MNAVTERSAKIKVMRESAPPVAPAVQPDTPSAAKRQYPPNELLADQLEIGATIATLLSMNFGGDGSFDPPCEAPGVRGMVQALAAAATSAHVLACTHGFNDIPQIAHAAALAQHMEMLSSEELMEGGRGFRQGDMVLGMAFWTIERMLETACREVSK